MEPIVIVILEVSLIFVADPTPTFYNPLVREVANSPPPLGWIIAGFLLLLLVLMIYQKIKNFIKKIFKKR